MKNHGRLFGAFFLLLLCHETVAVEPIPKIKVRIGNKLRKIVVRGLDLSKLLIGTKKPKVYGGFKSIKFDCSRLGIKEKSEILKSKPILLASLGSPTGFINWGKIKYKGKLNILSNPELGSCDLVNETGIEHYISTLLSKEMLPSWPIEALKAQAVAARSYALHKIRSRQVSKGLGFDANYDLENSEKHQVSGSFFDESLSTYQASLSTKGEILVDSLGVLRPIFFHSKCGGRTYRPGQVWGHEIPDYVSVDCPHCRGLGKKTWSSIISIKDLKSVLRKSFLEMGKPGLAEKKFVIAPDRVGSANIRLYRGEHPVLIEKKYLRRFLGRNRVPSMNFQLFKKASHFVVKGEGNGHGVGLCQYGAKHLAELGWDYKRILAYYYPNYRLTKEY